MQEESRKRRRFIQAGLSIPLLTQLPWKNSFASTEPDNGFQVPQRIYDQLLRLYGYEVNLIVRTNRIELKAPKIAENGAVLPLTVKGEKGLVNSLAVFVEENAIPLVGTIRFHEGADLAVSFRCKLRKTSDVYVIAQTYDGLVGLKQNVKLTIGCGGG